MRAIPHIALGKVRCSAAVSGWSYLHTWLQYGFLRSYHTIKLTQGALTKTNLTGGSNEHERGVRIYDIQRTCTSSSLSIQPSCVEEEDTASTACGR